MFLILTIPRNLIKLLVICFIFKYSKHVNVCRVNPLISLISSSSFNSVFVGILKVGFKPCWWEYQLSWIPVLPILVTHV